MRLRPIIKLANEDAVLMVGVRMLHNTGAALLMVGVRMFHKTGAALLMVGVRMFHKTGAALLMVGVRMFHKTGAALLMIGQTRGGERRNTLRCNRAPCGHWHEVNSN